MSDYEELLLHQQMILCAAKVTVYDILMHPQKFKEGQSTAYCLIDKELDYGSSSLVLSFKKIDKWSIVS